MIELLRQEHQRQSEQGFRSRGAVAGGGTGWIRDLNASHCSRRRPFAYLLVFWALLASRNDLLIAPSIYRLRPELAGTQFFFSYDQQTRLQIAAGIRVVGFGPVCLAMVEFCAYLG
jgi:hypothetical protein